MNQHQLKLRRVLGPGLLTLYGLGTTIGAGIYALLGKIAGSAGYFAPFAFIVAALLAIFSAFSFSELASRYPKSAGEAVYVREGLRLTWLSTITGLVVAGTGIISTAALFIGFAAYLNSMIDIHEGAAILMAAAVLGGLAIWGIRASATVAAIITLVEIAGLLLVIAVGIWYESPSPSVIEKMEFDAIFSHFE